MTAEISIYYYLKRMDEELQDELKPKLKRYINLDSRSFNVNEPLPSTPQVGIIHASQRNNADLKAKIDSINFNLIILLSQGAGKAKEVTDEYQQEFSGAMIWECGTEYLIQNFERLEKQLTETVNNWILENWIATELNQLSALMLLCQGYLAIYEGLADLPADMVEQISKNLTVKKERVSEANWWLDALGLQDEESQIVNWEKWENFERDITQEWEDRANEPIPDSVSQLLDAIKETPIRLKQPQLVAEAYQSIVNSD